MAENHKKKDMRVAKSCAALSEALQKLLGQYSFARLTVNDLCEEARLSRATFYSHFRDKYDLLDYWLSNSKLVTLKNENDYIVIERTVNHFVRKNTKRLANLLDNANAETLDLLRNFIISLLDIELSANEDGKPNPHNIVLSNFCAGGIVNMLLWQKKNKFPQDFQMITPDLYAILATLLGWPAGLDEERGSGIPDA